MTQFWGLLVRINFAMGVATGITMDSSSAQLGYYSHYVGDIFGMPLALEGMVGSSWNQPSSACSSSDGIDVEARPSDHDALVAPRSSLSALWILIANGWNAAPGGCPLNFNTMRMELSSFGECCSIRWRRRSSSIRSPRLCDGFGVRTGDQRVYLLRGRNVDIAGVPWRGGELRIGLLHIRRRSRR